MSKSTTTQTTRAARDTGPEPEPAGFIVDLDDIARDHVPPDNGLRLPQEGLAQIAIDAAIGAPELRRIRRDGVAVIVEIPTPDWAPEVEAIMRSLGYFETVVSRSGSSPRHDRPTEGNDRVAQTLAAGHGVLGISTAPERFLPEVLVSAADVRVKLRPPGNRELATVIRLATGRRPRSLPPDLAAGLSYDDICTAIRLGSTPGQCVRRLVAASRAKFGGDDLRDVPPLGELHGYGRVMTWAEAFLRDLEAWRAGTLSWAEVSRTCCMASSPGLGKTSFVRSLAKTARLPLFSTSVGDWFSNSSGHLDAVLKEALRVISSAAAQSPAILFIDELDGLPNRNELSNRGRDYWLPIINGLLISLDGTASGPASRLVIIGATNHPERIDPALLRPGRLHPLIVIEPPDAEALAGIIRQHLGDDLRDTDLGGIARLGVGATGAQAAGWVKGARQTARAQRRPMVLADLAAQVAPPDDRPPELLRLIAKHEAAHALVSESLGVARIRIVDITLRATSAGVTRGRLNASAIMTRAQLDDFVVATLAGRAQDALSGQPNSGAGGVHGSDLATATIVVAMAHTAYGLGGSLLFRGRAEDTWRLLDLDADLRAKVEADLRRLHARAESCVREHQPAITAIADRLVTDRVLTGEAVREILATQGIRPQAMAGGVDVA
ncbi:AAA family ATPase [Methylobacterium sp. D48H]